jgi:hypothetical protein
MSLSGVQMHDLLDLRLIRPACGRGGQRVIGLELDHRPRDQAQRTCGALSDLELREQIFRHAFAALVAGKQSLRNDSMT